MAERRSSYSARPNNGGYKRRNDRPYGKSRGDRPARREVVLDLDMSLDAPAFAELGLPRPLTCTLANFDITEPFPIQRASIPDALAGRDLLGRGQTGSGKTLAFGLPMLARLMGRKSEPKHPRGLVLVPTRELAQQVRDALTPLAHQSKLSLQLVIGGASYQQQMDGMARGADIVIATPGRLGDLVERRAVDLSQVEIAVLDEADQMCDMGFYDEVEALMQLVAPDGQRMLFSATLDGQVQRLVNAHLKDPIEHATDPDTASVATMTHHLFVVDAREKPSIVHSIAKREGRTICFARTQLGVEQWAGEFADMGIRVDALHGGKSQGARSKAIENFKSGRVDVLVATDVAARGIHVDGIDLVLQIDPPRDPKDYLHRAGRTARAGKDGVVVLISTTRQIRGSERLLKDAGVDAIDKRVHVGDEYLADVTGAREEVAPQPRRTHLKDEQAVRRAVIEHDDELSFVDHREARPRTARVDDHRFAPRRDDRNRYDARRVERQAERPRFDRDERPSFNREDRPRFQRDDRPRYDRDNRGERPGFNREDRPRFQRDDRPRFDRDNRGERPGFNREDRPRFQRDDRPRFDRDNRGERPGFNREDRPRFQRDDRPRFDRNDRPGFQRDDRPRFDRDNRGERPRFERNDRPARDDRPAARDDRRRPAAPSGNRKQTDKPRWKAADRKGHKGR